MKQEMTDVIIIGAGPSGSVAGNLLRKAGHKVVVLDKETFPRFVIGESLLPHCMTFIEKAGLLREVVEAGFQYKNGAAFVFGEQRSAFDFRQKFTEGWGTTYQVQRGVFDKVLADAAAKQGLEIRYRHEVLTVDVSGAQPVVNVRSPEGEYTLTGKFLLDASGYGRVLPRLLNLEKPALLPPRRAVFTHIEDNIDLHAIDVPSGVPFDRNKIRVTVHPQHRDIWYWLIPFSNNRTSIGVVGRTEQIGEPPSGDPAYLRDIVNQDAGLANLFKNARWDTPVRQIRGYSANVTTLCGNNYALLGNAGEFLDPVFSSGVSIAFKSADLAASVLIRQLAGEAVDWQRDYAVPLMKGVDCFRVFVDAWYDCRLQDVIFHPDKNPKIKDMISSVLAGYAWDEANPFVSQAARRLSSLQAACEMA